MRIETKRMAKVLVSTAIVESILNNGIGDFDIKFEPTSKYKNIKILGVQYGMFHETIELLITSPDLPELEQGMIVPKINLEFRQIRKEPILI